MAQDKTTHPGVENAYPLAASSYEVALKRLDAIDGRLQTIIAFIVATSAAIPSIASGRISFKSYYFYFAVACFALGIIVGVAARLFGRFKVVRPRYLFNYWLHKPDWEFKMDFINQAADDFDRNTTLLNRKWWCSVAVSLLFCVQAGLLVAWVVLGSS
jgi:hypothetical protein